MYFAAQRESRNAALLEKIAHALSHDTDALPVRVRAEPRTLKNALDNSWPFLPRAARGSSSTSSSKCRTQIPSKSRPCPA